MVVGFICYSGAVAILMIDVGQPLRAWLASGIPIRTRCSRKDASAFICYLLVLCLEYVPILLRNRQLRKLHRSWYLNINCTN